MSLFGGVDNDVNTEVLARNDLTARSLAAAYHEICYEIAFFSGAVTEVAEDENGDEIEEEADDLTPTQRLENNHYCQFLRELKKDLNSIFLDPLRAYPNFENLATADEKDVIKSGRSPLQKTINERQSAHFFQYIKSCYQKNRALFLKIEANKSKFVKDQRKIKLLEKIGRYLHENKCILEQVIGYKSIEPTIASKNSDEKSEQSPEPLNHVNENQELVSMHNVCQATWEHEYMKQFEDIYHDAELLGIIYYRTCQVFDPLQGLYLEQKKWHPWGANCHGHARKYNLDVTKFGQHRQILALDPITEREQSRKQIFGRNCNFEQQYVRSKNWIAVVHQLLESISNLSIKHVYLLSIEDTAGHSCTIRLLPDGAVEFFQPNLACFASKQKEHFKIWLALYFARRQKVPQVIELFQMGLQPDTAKTTIPVLDIKLDPDDIKDQIKKLIALDDLTVYEKSNLRQKLNLLEQQQRRFNCAYILLNHLNAEDTGAQRQMTQQLQQDQLMRYEMLRKDLIRDDTTKEKATDAKTQLASIEQDCLSLKDKIINKIKDEISRLENGWFSTDIAQQKIAALQNLIERIISLPLEKLYCVNFFSIITEWLKTKPKDSQKSYQQILAIPRWEIGDTATLIDSLRHQEINPHRLDRLRTGLLMSMMCYLRLDPTMVPKQTIQRNSLPAMIMDALQTYQTPRNILLKIKNWKEAIIYNNEAKEVHTMLHVIDIDDPQQLLALTQQITKKLKGPVFVLENPKKEETSAVANPKQANEGNPKLICA